MNSYDNFINPKLSVSKYIGSHLFVIGSYLLMAP